MESRGSTVRARFGGLLVDSHDTWFGPTDLCLGPDGSMYLSDFHDRRTAHPDPDAAWDRTNGRIYKIESTGTPPGVPVEIGKLSSAELVDCLRRSNRWLADRARRELHDRRDPAVVPHLRNMARQKRDGLLALQGLWAFNGVQGIDEPLATELLTHPYPHVRLWVVRLLGDGKILSDSMLLQLANLAASDGNPAVLAQLAASAKRLSGEQGLGIIEQLLDRTESLEDERTRWLVWWAIENNALSNSDRLLKMFARPEAWYRPAWSENALRLVRRWSADGTPVGYDSCLSLLQSVPAEQRLRAHESFRQGLSERATGLHGIGQGDLFRQHAAVDEPLDQVSRSYQPVTVELRDYVNRLWQDDRNGLLFLELALLTEIGEAKEHLKQSLAEPANQSAEQVVARLNLLSRFGDSENIHLFLKYAADTEKERVRLAAIRGLSRFDSPRTTETLLDLYPADSAAVQSGLRTLFFSRAPSGRAFLELVQAGTIDAKEIPVREVGQLSLHEDQVIEALVLEIWGTIGPGSSEEKLAQMRRYNNDLRLAEGNATQGQALFRKHCGNCHVLHLEGKKIGPDLTPANRKDRAALLANIVDPGAVVRREYLSYMLVTGTGRIITGLLLEQNAAGVTVLDEKLQSIKVPRDQIAELTVREQSFMPERILENLSSDERRHLFAYLEQ
jgi:putative heme-binding domain-containing protein